MQTPPPTTHSPLVPPAYRHPRPTPYYQPCSNFTATERAVLRAYIYAGNMLTHTPGDRLADPLAFETFQKMRPYCSCVLIAAAYAGRNPRQLRQLIWPSFIKDQSNNVLGWAKREHYS